MFDAPFMYVGLNGDMKGVLQISMTDLCANSLADAQANVDYARTKSTGVGALSHSSKTCRNLGYSYAGQRPHPPILLVMFIQRVRGAL